MKGTSTSQMLKRCLAKFMVIATLGNVTSTAVAGTFTFRFGPPSLGQGGANPLGIPPGSTDIEASYLTDGLWETSLSISPGLLIGKRHKINNFYVGLGGGLIIDANGSGLGPYSSFGWESSGSSVRYGIEYKQALGITGGGMISPYALRAGLGFVF